MQVEATVFLLSGVVVEENKATQEESRFFLVRCLAMKKNMVLTSKKGKRCLCSHHQYATNTIHYNKMLIEPHL